MLLSNSRVGTFQRKHTSSHRACVAAQLRSSSGRIRVATDAMLPAGLRAESLPRHVAVVVDGNSRWAQVQGLPHAAGNERGLDAMKGMVGLSRLWGIRVLTVFAFSSENLNRPKVEVEFAMKMIGRFIQEITDEYSSQGVRLRIIGDYAWLPVALQNTAREAQEATRNNSQLDVIVATGYSGRWDILQACRKLVQKVHEKRLRLEDIDEAMFADELETSFTESPYPDLLIRTSGERRLSNFLLWQTAYSELFFTKTFWPDFGEADYLEALISFQSRDRRFGQRKS